MIGQLISEEIIDNKTWLVFYNEEDMLSFFYGVRISNPDEVTLKKDEEDRRHFTYLSNQIYFKKATNHSTESYYLGEMIVFRTIDTEEKKMKIIQDLFISILEGLKSNVWIDLRDALDDLSRFFSLFGKSDSVLKGYIGEVSIIYNLLFNSKYSNKVKLANFLITSYQKIAKKRHDYNYSSNLRVEVKSTSTERNLFEINWEQQRKNREGSNLIYAFVKYNYSRTSQPNWISLIEMIEQIKSYDGVVSSEWNKANHLYRVSNIDNSKDWKIDPKNIEVFLIDSAKLPSFSESDSSAYVSEISYKFNLDKFLADNKYSDERGYEWLFNLFLNEGGNNG